MAGVLFVLHIPVDYFEEGIPTEGKKEGKRGAKGAALIREEKEAKKKEEQDQEEEKTDPEISETSPLISGTEQETSPDQTDENIQDKQSVLSKSPSDPTIEQGSGKVKSITIIINKFCGLPQQTSVPSQVTVVC